MAYSELIKNFERIREYMREFYVYGFKSRDEIDIKSARGYDDERRRIESWLNDCMGFRRGPEGKAVFLSLDSRSIARNPLHKAFRAKSFTRNDILLHFVLLDMLGEGALTAREAVDRIAGEYLSRIEHAECPDESTVRKKLAEYARLGLLRAQRDGRSLRYARVQDAVDLRAWADAIAFYAEADVLGVVGGYLIDRLDEAPDCFRFKHHYLLRAFESELLLNALGAIRERRNVVLHMGGGGFGGRMAWRVTPVKVLASTQTGRYYLCAFSPRRGRLCCYRIDHMRAIDVLDAEPKFEEYAARFVQVRRHLWGAALGSNRSVGRVEMVIRVEAGEEYIVQRLQREKRCGAVEQVDDHHWRFTADVYDPYELNPWVRTFIGRIADFRCSDPAVEERFRDDVRAALKQYEGGDANAVQ